MRWVLEVDILQVPPQYPQAVPRAMERILVAAATDSQASTTAMVGWLLIRPPPRRSGPQAAFQGVQERPVVELVGLHDRPLRPLVP